MIWILLALQLYIPTLTKDRGPHVLMQGSWESCHDGDDYAERAFVFRFKGRVIFEAHLGTRDEFALFGWELPEHIAHSDPRNILGPAFHYSDVPTRAGGRTWSSAQLGVRFNAVQLPDATCANGYAYMVLIEHTSPIWDSR